MHTRRNAAGRFQGARARARDLPTADIEPSLLYADVGLLRGFKYVIASAVAGNEMVARFDVGGCLCCEV
jgi:hypothetical protein